MSYQIRAERSIGIFSTPKISLQVTFDNLTWKRIVFYKNDNDQFIHECSIELNLCAKFFIKEGYILSVPTKFPDRIQLKLAPKALIIAL
jgi:hypothetical protein